MVAGESDWPLLVRVVDVTGTGPDGLVHVDVLGVLFPCDLNFEGERAGVVLAPVPAVGAPPVGDVVYAGTSRIAWSPSGDGWQPSGPGEFSSSHQDSAL
ncbi:hypothetical protein ACI79J_01960 [Geodermatophilus sp. SYSU D01062]